MPYIVWDKSFEIGLRDIDRQHAELMGAINTLHSAFITKKHTDALEEALFTLDSYSKFHFQTEEDLMNEHEYPGAAAHREKHETFRGRMSDFRMRPESVSPAADVQVLLAFLKGWFANHVQGDDRKYIPFFQSKGLIVRIEEKPEEDTSVDRESHTRKLIDSIKFIPLLPWRAKYNIGEKRIDKQHQNLVDLINVLYATIEKPNRTDVVENALKELHAFTDYHFEYEEKLLAELGLPDIDAHRNMHREFRLQTAEIKSKYIKYKTVVDHDLVVSLRTWFVSHEISQDAQITSYLPKT